MKVRFKITIVKGEVAILRRKDYEVLSKAQEATNILALRVWSPARGKRLALA